MAVDWNSALGERLTQQPAPVGVDQPAEIQIWELLRQRCRIANYHPKANPAVIVRELQGRQGRYYVLKNTIEKTYLRLSSMEYGLWSWMDGQRSVQDLIVDHFMTTGSFAHQMVIHLVEQLHQNQMLDERSVRTWGQINAQIEKRSWLYRLSSPARLILTQRLSIDHIDDWISRLYRYGGWLFFTRVAKGIFLLVSLLGLAAFIKILSDPEYVFLGGNFVVSLLVLWGVSLFPVIIHELGHALTLKHYGREVPRGGFMLYFGMPAAFVETTDIWLEPRPRRLAVTWNGPYTGLILGGAAALVMVAFPAAAVNNLLFKLAGLAYLSVFINVNPLLKLDGYYLLTDALDIASLREKSLLFVRKQLLGKFRQRKKFTRDELIFTLFGLFSLAWTLYAIYLALFFWRTRVSNSLQAVLGVGYPLLSRLLSLLLLAALVSFLFLIVVQLIRFGHGLVDRFIRSGGLTKHGRLALILAGVALGLGIGLPLIFPSYVRWISATLGLLISLLAAFKMIPFSRSYLWSPRGLAFLIFGLSMFLGGLIGPAQWLPNAAYFINIAQWGSLILLLAGLVLVVWPAQAHLQPGNVVAGLLIGGSILALLRWLADISLSDARIWFVAALGMLGVIATGSLRGSSRSPAMGLLCLGGLALGFAWFYQQPFGDIMLVAILLLGAGGLHLVYARLPKLSTYRPEEIVNDLHWVIGESLGILVRRAVAQIYFELGRHGVERLGRDFSSSMRQHGVAISIQGKTVDDRELPNRSTAELTGIYSLVIDELHRLVCHEIGHKMGTLTFGYGIDLLPWEHREIVSELILSRQSWGLALTQAVSDARQARRKLLKKVPLFFNCTDIELDRLASTFKAEQFASGETVITQGSFGDRFYIIERGLVTIWKTDEEGLERRVVKLGRGQYFGEAALVSNKPRNATVRAETPLALLSLNNKDFDRLVRQYLTLADQVDEHVRYSWLLREMPIFDDLDYADLESLSKLLETEHFQANQVVFSEGDRGNKFYIVESGALSVTQTIHGKAVELSQRGPGEYVGEIALLQDGSRTATITALEDTTLLSLKSEHFHQLVSRFLSVGEILSRTSTRRLAMDQRIDAGMFASTQIPEV